MTSTITRLYQASLPMPFRTVLWHARTALSANNRVDRTRGIAGIWTALGWHLHTVRINDCKLTVDLRDELGVGRPLWSTGKYEPAETIFLRRELQQGGTFVDIGANLGYFSTLGAKCVGPQGKVIAIEPDPHNFSLLLRNVLRNSLDQVALYNVALGERPSTLFFNRSKTNFGDHRVST